MSVICMPSAISSKLAAVFLLSQTSSTGTTPSFHWFTLLLILSTRFKWAKATSDTQIVRLNSRNRILKISRSALALWLMRLFARVPLSRNPYELVWQSESFPDFFYGSRVVPHVYWDFAPNDVRRYGNRVDYLQLCLINYKLLYIYMRVTVGCCTLSSNYQTCVR